MSTNEQLINSFAIDLAEVFNKHKVCIDTSEFEEIWSIDDRKIIHTIIGCPDNVIILYFDDKCKLQDIVV